MSPVIYAWVPGNICAPHISTQGLCVDEYLMGTSRPGELDVDIPGIDADSAFAVTFKHDEKVCHPPIRSLIRISHEPLKCCLAPTTSRWPSTWAGLLPQVDESSLVCVQCALLYTTSFGERRIRVLTLSLQVGTPMRSQLFCCA